MSEQSEIYKVLLQIKDEFGCLRTVVSQHTEILNKIESQTTKTNGRVNKLEDKSVQVDQAIIKLTELTSKQNGIYEQNLLAIENRIDTRGLEIDELKKKVSGEAVDLIKIEKQGGIELKKVIWGGLIGIAGTLLTLIVTKII